MRLSIGKNNSGFTLFEVIAVLVLVSIFTTVAIVQHAKTDPTLIVQSQVLRSHLRYVQMRSMNSDVRWGIEYHNNGPSNRYYEIFTGVSGNIADLPGESEKKVQLNVMGISIDSAVGGPFSSGSFDIRFDSWGRPFMNDSLVTIPITLRLSKSGHNPELLTIIRNTGFIQ